MKYVKLKSLRCSLVFLIALMAMGCVDVQEPSAPDIEYEGGTGGAASHCECSADDMEERAYRFTELQVVEPLSLKDTLNSQWEHELENYLTNVLVMVVDADSDDAASELTAFNAMRVVAGPGWREPDDDYLVDDDFEPDSYAFLEGLTIGVELSPVEGEQCRLANEDFPSLYFHLGPLNDPLMCAPTLEPANATPIENMRIRFNFNEDCSEIVSGYLLGCIPGDAADRICMCTSASQCTQEDADPSYDFPDLEEVADEDRSAELRDYCQNACGYTPSDERPDDVLLWTPFGAVLSSAGIPKTCAGANGSPGVMLELSFTAEEIDNLEVDSVGDLGDLFQPDDEE